jgi:hypothetical protein
MECNMPDSNERDLKPENISDTERWHSRHQRHEELPAHIQAESAERVAAGCMVFVARGSGRMHGPDGDGIEDGEWRLEAWPMAPLNGPEAFLSLSLPWVNDIGQSSTMETMGGIALDLASCERLAEAAAHAAAVLRAGQWAPRPPGLAEVTAERDELKRRVEELEVETANLYCAPGGALRKV